MDPLDIASFETPSEDASAAPSEMEKEEADNTASQSQTDNSEDIFGGDSFDSPPPDVPTEPPKLSATKGHNLLFSLDDGEDGASPFSGSSGGESQAVFASLQKVAKDEEEPSHASRSLFDDLLDFSPSKSSNLDEDSKNEVTDSTPVSKVDLLFGVDDDLVSPSEPQPEVETKNPDILDFVDVPPDLPETSTTETMNNVNSDPFSGPGILISPKVTKQSSPDILGKSPNFGYDATEGRVTKREEEKKDESAKKEKRRVTLSLGETNNMTDSVGSPVIEDFDFSVIELTASNLSFDITKHKRTLSKKGSIANRKKPSRASIMPNSEDSLFQDSTEPRSPKSPSTDEEDESTSPIQEKSFSQQNGDSSSREVTPSKRPSGGMKIPGLLEGLTKSKAFASKSPETERGRSPASSSPVAAPLPQPVAVPLPQPVILVPASAKTSPGPPVQPKPKPIICPRSFPPASKNLKESQNQNTAGETPTRTEQPRGLTASVSFRDPSSAGRPTVVVKSSPVLGRSASMKVTSVSVVSQPSTPERTTLIVGPKMLPTNPDAQRSSPGKNVPKPETKIPPPVASKPSVPVKPNRSSLAMSASFSGERPVLRSTVTSGRRPASTYALDTQQHASSGAHPTQRPFSNITSSVTLPVDSYLSNADQKSGEINFTVKAEQKPAYRITSSTEQKPVVSVRTERRVLPGIPTKNVNEDVIKSTPNKKDSVTIRVTSKETEISRGDVSGTSPSKKPETSVFMDRILIKPGESARNLDKMKSQTFDLDDVFNITEHSNTSSRIVVSSSSGDKSEGASEQVDLSPPRKSSISGVMSVKSPSSSEKPSSTAMPRKGSITGSAYNPIGFRSALGSSDSDSKSRGNSVSSVDGTAAAMSSSPGSMITVTVPAVRPRGDSSPSSEGQRSRDGSFNSKVNIQLGDSPVKFQGRDPDMKLKRRSYPEMKFTVQLTSAIRKDDKKTETADPTPAVRKDDRRKEASDLPTAVRKEERKKEATNLPTAVRKDDKKKEATDEANRSIRDQTRTPKDSGTPPSKINVTTSSEKPNGTAGKTSPWGVSLRKVEKKEPPPKPDRASKANDGQTMNWRQSLSMRRKSPVPEKESEKAKQDNTPEWAKASIKRRQRLIDSGVIKKEAAQ